MKESPDMAQSIHGTAIAFSDFGVLIQGPPGSGKSSLALQLIDQTGYGLGTIPLKTELVSDDQVVIEPQTDCLILSPPPALAGLLEIRGYGILKTPFRTSVRLKLIATLNDVTKLQRLPEEQDQTVTLHSVRVPVLRLPANDPSSAARLRAVVSKVQLQ
jgi:HPr kinase/phosphorylase